MGFSWTAISRLGISQINTFQKNHKAQQEQVTRVLIVEDHIEYREVVEIAMNKAPDITVVGTFGAAEVALRGVQNLEEFRMPM